MHEPGKKHKRSKAEARRVKMVESALTGLNNQRFPGEKTPILKNRSISVTHVPAADTITKPALDPAKMPPGYDSYIQLHT